MGKFKIILVILLILASQSAQSKTPDNSRMWAKVECASETARFIFNLPHQGLVSIISTVPGKKQTDRLWGPRFMNAGTFKIDLPARRIVSRSGVIELFNIDVIPEKTFGSRGIGERQFSHPMGIDFDSTRKELLVADTGNDRIVKLSPEGRFISQHGGFGLAFGDRSEEREDSLDEPFDVAIGGYSDFFVSDQNNDRVCIFDAYQSYKGNLYPSEKDRRRGGLDRPRGIKVDFENNIWIVDGRADKIIKISSFGEKLFEVGGFGYSTYQLKNPNQVDINQHGEIYIADRGNGRIAIFDRLGSYLSEMKDHLKTPTGVAIDEDGLIIVCDDSTNELGVYTPRGIRLTYLAATADNSPFRQPSDIAISEDRIFLLDSGNHRIITFARKKRGSAVAWQAKDAVLE
jgi:sugar lactone lactonase YvrE